jgi:hypothetical protein
VTVLSFAPVTGASIDSDVKTIGDTIVYNITVQDVSMLGNWQVNVTWDQTLLNYSSFSIPSDNVFATSGQSLITPAPVFGSGWASFGASLLDASAWNYNGSGVLCQITLTIIHQPANPSSSSTIGFEGKYSNTFLLAGIEGTTIPFNIQTSTFTYNLIQTVTHTVGSFTVTTFSNTSILRNNVTQLGDGSLQFNANGANGTAYFVNVTIPTGLLGGVGKVTVNGVDVTTQALISSGGGNTYVYYSSTFGTSSTPSTFSTINLIPEGLLLLLMAGMIASLASAAFIKTSRKRRAE